jgi:serine/threonine protein kinase
MNHAHIASVHDVIEQDGADCIVMELVVGESLAAKLRGGALPVREATTIALQVAEALEEAHEQGVIHRDLKPANVMITPKGQAKVLDFGLARLLGPADVTQTAMETGGVMGTPLYMSPEWTPDGRRFLFNSDREGRGNVYELEKPRWFEFWKKPEAMRLTGNQLNITDATPARDSKSLYVLGGWKRERCRSSIHGRGSSCRFSGGCQLRSLWCLRTGSGWRTRNTRAGICGRAGWMAARRYS